ncbi:MAG: DNA internalization-related competence protein ComEC/Rec2 [Candidatus Bipolaricaulis sibiricus]|uniref:DNA internalization-related competence protein ComEC/Rec2 n=1 Tax=Bipolaricaulis sibiricus TaxID=2501609 RepID=A0A410FWQ6_BIPS1|nr:MAG: DNA internalization-related competence protein ComEC/Rec2 [Candidatus Bipolaricaulis sibiricus]
MGRALLPGLGAALGFGIAFGYLLTPGLSAMAAAGGALIVAAARRSPIALWVAACALGAGLAVPETLPSHYAFQLPNLREVTGRVLDIPEPRTKNVSFTLSVDTLGVDLLAYVPRHPAVGPGDQVKVIGRWGLPQPEGWRAGLARRGIHGLFWADEVEVLAPGPPSLARWASHVRQTLLSHLYRVAPEGTERASPALDLLAALLLGARGMFPSEEQQAFRTAGVAHVLALSGLHVGILVAGGWWLLGLVRVRPAWRYLVLVPAVGFYVLVGGARVSLIRAAIMFAVLGLFWLLLERGWVLRRWLDPVQGLALAATVVLLVWPWSALDTGFQLSFLATGGIVVLLPGWTGSDLRRRLPGWTRRAADLLAVTLCAQAGAVPVIGTVFGHVSPYGILANVVLVPWTGLLLWGGILVIALAALPISLPLTFLVEAVLVGPYLAIVQWVSGLPGASLVVGPGFGAWCLLAALGILLLRVIAEEPGSPCASPSRCRGPRGEDPLRAKRVAPRSPSVG